MWLLVPRSSVLDQSSVSIPDSADRKCLRLSELDALVLRTQLSHWGTETPVGSSSNVAKWWRPGPGREQVWTQQAQSRLGPAGSGGA